LISWRLGVWAVQSSFCFVLPGGSVFGLLIFRASGLTRLRRTRAFLTRSLKRPRQKAFHRAFRPVIHSRQAAQAASLLSRQAAAQTVRSFARFFITLLAVFPNKSRI